MLSARQTKALEAVIAHPNHTDAARAAGIAPRTLRGYLANDEFKGAYRAAMTQVVDGAVRRLQKALSPAVGALEAVLQDEEFPPAVKVSAARALLEYGLRYTEFNDVLQRIRELEGDGQCITRD